MKGLISILLSLFLGVMWPISALSADVPSAEVSAEQGMIDESELPASNAAAKEYAYYAFDPDIITNYIADGKHFGYVRVTVEVMVENKLDLALIEKHKPLLRDALIQILGSMSRNEARSLKDRELFRLKCLRRLNDLLLEEEGKKAVKELLFTKYLYQ